jgi:two-component system sensor histidine kinase/response regulator
MARRHTTLGNEVFQRIADSSGDAVICCDTSGVIMYWNPGADGIFGFSADEILGSLFLELVPSRFHSIYTHFLERWNRATRFAERSSRFQVTVVRKDGLEFPGRLAVSRIDCDGFVLFCISLHDVTERRHQIENQQLLAAIVQSSDDAIVGEAFDGKIVSWNHGAEVLFGYAPNAIIDQHRSILTPPGHEDETANIVETVTRGNRVEHFETQRLCKDGKVVEVSVSVSPIRGISGQVIGSSTITRDVTVARRARDLEAAREIAEAANRSKSLFLASMIHEIRTPMNGNLGMAHLLEDSDLDDEQRESVQVIRNSASSLLTIINDILDLSKIEAGKLDLEEIPFRLLGVVEEARDVIRPVTREKKLTFDLQSESDVPRGLLGDGGRVKQILLNFLSNASKFTDSGSIHVRVTNLETTREEDEKRIAAIKLSVQDTGIGISEEQIESIFDKYAQADASTTRRFDGTGLGLAIASCYRAL